MILVIVFPLHYALNWNKWKQYNIDTAGNRSRATLWRSYRDHRSSTPGCCHVEATTSMCYDVMRSCFTVASQAVRQRPLIGFDFHCSQRSVVSRNSWHYFNTTAALIAHGLTTPPLRDVVNIRATSRLTDYSSDAPRDSFWSRNTRYSNGVSMNIIIVFYRVRAGELKIPTCLWLCQIWWLIRSDRANSIPIPELELELARKSNSATELTPALLTRSLRITK